MSAPPPPPPHGDAPKSTGGSGLPPGNYDIFVIPEHSAGAGFLYLPSLRPNINSFVAGFASALALVALGNSMAPAFRAWWANFQGMGSFGMIMLVVAVGLGAWSLGRIQQDEPGDKGGPTGGRASNGGATGGANGAGGTPPGYSSSPPPPQSPPHNGQDRAGQPPPASDSPPNGGPPPGQNQYQSSEQPKSSWQQGPQQSYQRQAPPPPGSTPKSTPNAESAKGAWQKAREETRRKEDERRAQEAEKRRRDEAAAKLREIREREIRERLERERRDREEKERRERELKDKRDRELRERLEREQREKELKEQRERIEKELREKIEKETREKQERERAAGAEAERLRKAEEQEERKKELDRINRKGSSYAFSAVGERTNPWPNGKPPVSPSAAGGAAPRSAPPPTTSTPSSFGAGATSPRKPVPATASASPSQFRQAHVQDEDEAYSYRPYDKPKKPQPARKKSVSDVSDTSWAPSHSTAHTTPPPSTRQPYTTNDPDKIVIRAVYGFLNQFAKTPSSQLLSGVGTVTDGLILRITTEGLFIDDDVRGVPQREWDVKAWTLKLVEVWCPAHAIALANSASASANERGGTPSAKPAAAAWRKAFFAGGGVRGDPRPLTDDNADAYLEDMLRECKALCSLGLCETCVSPSAFGAFDDSASASSHSASSRSGTKSNPQSGEYKTKGLHLLRATVRDQEGKRFLFVLDQEEAWKVSMGLQRLRRGTQVRSLGVASLTNAEVRTTLDLLGWA